MHNPTRQKEAIARGRTNPGPIALIDYGAGNLRSVSNALEALGQSVLVPNKPSEIHDASALVVSGVGAFGDGMASLCDSGLIDVLHEEVQNRKKPFLGICLGLQLLATESHELGHHRGLGWMGGTVRRFKSEDPTLRVPHMGWNEVNVKRSSGLFEGVGETPVLYFAHSYIYEAAPDAEEYVTSTCRHGEEFVSSVQRENIYGVQFHPERSQSAGLKILENFLKVVRGA